MHDNLSAMKEVRDQALEKLKRERQLQATKASFSSAYRESSPGAEQESEGGAQTESGRTRLYSK